MNLKKNSCFCTQCATGYKCYAEIDAANKLIEL